MSNPQVQTPNIVNTHVIDTEGVKFTYREITLEVLYSFTPMTTTCEVFEALASVFEELEQIWYRYDIMVDYAPDEVIVDGGVNRELGKALSIIIDELKDGKQLSEVIPTIKFFIDFDVDEALYVLRKIQSVTRLFDGYGYCYLIQLREE